jgi:hypothetical protein
MKNLPEIQCRLPTDEEVKRNTLASWEAVEPVLLSRLHPEILRLSMPTRFVTVPTRQITEWWLPGFDGQNAPQKAAAQLLAGGRAALADYPGGFFFKLDGRSPKDCGIVRYTADNLHELPPHFFCSERMLDDLVAQRFHRDGFVLCFRKWVELADEQRVFVRNGTIQGMSRYDYRNEPTAEYTEDHITHVQAAAAEYVTAISPYMATPDYVFDFGYLPHGKPILIELNPYGLSDPCCFRSYDSVAGYAWRQS